MHCSRSRSWVLWSWRCWAGRSRCGGDSAASTASSASTSSARRCSRRRFRELIEHSPDLYYTHELDGRIASLNPAVERITGYSRESLIGQPIQVLSGEDEGASVSQPPVDNTFGPQHEMAIFTRDGRRRLLEVSERLVVEGGRAIAVQGVARDVTERRETELALRESERRYRALFDSLPMPVWVYDDVTLAFLSANDAAVQYYGYSRDELLSMTILDVRPPEDVPAMLDALETCARAATSSRAPSATGRRTGRSSRSKSSRTKSCWAGTCRGSPPCAT